MIGFKTKHGRVSWSVFSGKIFTNIDPLIGSIVSSSSLSFLCTVSVCVFTHVCIPLLIFFLFLSSCLLFFSQPHVLIWCWRLVLLWEAKADSCPQGHLLHIRIKSPWWLKSIIDSWEMCVCAYVCVCWNNTRQWQTDESMLSRQQKKDQSLVRWKEGGWDRFQINERELRGSQTNRRVFDSNADYLSAASAVYRGGVNTTRHLKCTWMSMTHPVKCFECEPLNQWEEMNSV